MRKQSRFAVPSKSKPAPAGRKAGGRGASRKPRSSESHASARPEPRPAGRTESSPRPRIEFPPHERIVIGTHAILEAIATNPKSCRELWLKVGWESSQDLKKIQAELRPHGISPVLKADTVLDRLGSSHQGAALFMSSAPEIDWSEIHRAAEATLLVLDGIEDPHNLGAILRTSWLMGVKGVVIPEDRAVGLTATVHKVACGGAEHVPLEKTTNFASPLEELKKQGYWIFGLSHEGKRSLFDLQIPEKVVWCIGAEDKGLRTTTERLCDELVSIPQVSAAASYNASVATSIALTETLRQRLKSNEKNSANL